MAMGPNTRTAQESASPATLLGQCSKGTNTRAADESGSQNYGIESLSDGSTYDTSASVVDEPCTEFASSRGLLEESHTNPSAIYEGWVLWNDPEACSVMVLVRGSVTSPAKKRSVESVDKEPTDVLDLI